MRQIRILLWIVLAIAWARLLWIGLIRQDTLQRLDRAVQNRHNRADGDVADDGSVRITHFYPRSGGEIFDGDQELICYGVRNAERVWVEPPVEKLAPTLTRCFFVEPRQDTSYTLLAEGAGGRRVSQSLQVRVKPAPAQIRMLAVSDHQVRKGEAMTVCYGVDHARSVRLEPVGWQLASTAKDCVRFYPSASTTFSLVAVGDGGTDRRAFRVAVK